MNVTLGFGDERQKMLTRALWIHGHMREAHLFRIWRIDLLFAELFDVIERRGLLTIVAAAASLFGAS